MLLPGNSEQWYNENDQWLLRAEISAMKKSFPKARFGFLKSNDDMFWAVDVKLDNNISERVWRLIVIYDKQYGQKKGYSSIHVIPCKPDLEEILEIIQDVEHISRKEVPHTYVGYHGLRCLDITRSAQDILNKDGRSFYGAAWHLINILNNWIIPFEMGIRDQRTWDDWCGTYIP